MHEIGQFSSKGGEERLWQTFPASGLVKRTAPSVAIQGPFSFCRLQMVVDERNSLWL